MKHSVAVATLFMCLCVPTQGQQVTAAKQQKKTDKPPTTVQETAERRILSIGDLGTICPNEACPAGTATVVFGDNDGEARPGKVVSIIGNTAVIQYNSDASFHPSRVMVVGQATTKNAIPQVVVLKAAQDLTGLKQKRVTLRGDFHSAENGSPCHDGYLLDTRLNSVTTNIISVGNREAVIAYSATDDFTPDTFTLLCTSGPPITVPFLVFRGLHTTIAGFSSQDITEDFCGVACKDIAAGKVTLSLQPFDPDAAATLLRVTVGRVWVEITAPPEYSPTSVMLEIDRGDGNRSAAYAKRLLGPAVDDHQPFVTYTPMDSNAAKTNFGRRIAFNYLAVNVQVHNPTDQKIQLNKARLWFDCDYAEIAFKNLYSNNPTYLKSGDRAKKYLFGIDHTQRQFPHTLQQVIGTFDAQTGLEKAVFDGADLSGSVLAALTALFNTTPYSVGVNAFTGIFAPGMRKIIMNTDMMNQKRQSLMLQALDSYLQVPPKGATSTLVFLPRKGILAWQDTGGQDQQIPVVIDLIRDVHFEPEIVIDAAGFQDMVVTSGMTEEQVKKILGEPTTRNENNGQVAYTYSSGPYKEVGFKKDGTGVYRVSTMVERPASEQLVEGKTTVAAAEMLLGASRPDLKDAVDGGKIWLDAPLMKSDLLFGPDNVLKKRSYQNALSVLKGLSKPKVSDVKSKAEDLALNAETKKKIDDAFKAGAQAGIYRIPSPDLAGQSIIVRCKDTNPTDNSEVTDIN